MGEVERGSPRGPFKLYGFTTMEAEGEDWDPVKLV